MVDKTISVRIIGDSGQYIASVSAAGAATQTFGTQVAAASNKAATSVSRFGKIAANVGKITVLGVAAGLALSASAAIKFESAFAGIRKTVDTSEAGFEILEGSLRSLALQIPISVNELARIGELGGQLGISAGGIPEFTDTIAKLGVTTTLSIEEAALGFARLDNILGLNQQSFDRMGSTIVDLGNNFAATEDEILTFALRVAPIASTVGLAADEVFAIATAFTSVGVRAERGGTAIQKTFISILEAVQNGGDELRIFAEIAGITEEAFVSLFESDPAAAFDAIIVGFGRLNDEGRNITGILDSVGLGDARVTQSILAAANASGVLTDALKASEDSWNENIALTEEAEKRFETTESRMKLAGNQINDMAISLGQQLLPVIGDVVDGFGDFLAGLQSADPIIRNVIGVIVGSIVGIQAANLAYKLLAKTIGVDLVAGMATAGLAAGVLKAAIGGALLVIIGFAIDRFISYGQTQSDTKLRVDSLVGALKQQAEGLEDVTFQVIRNQLVSEGYLDILNGAGIGLDSFARAILGQGDALKLVRDRMSEVKGEVKDSVLGYSKWEESAEGLGGVLVQNEDQLRRAKERGAELVQIEDLLIARTGDFAVAQAIANEELAALAESRRLDAIAEGFDGVEEKMKEAALTGGTVVESMKDIGSIAVITDSAIGEVSDALDSYVDTLDDAFSESEDLIRGQIDVWGEMGDAVEFNVSDIIANIQEQLNAQRAFQGLLAGIDLSSEVRSIFDAYTLEQQAGFVLLAESAPADAQKLISFYESRFGPNGAIMNVVADTFGTRLPAILKKGGDQLVSDLSDIVTKVTDEEDIDPVAAWLGVVQETLLQAGDDLRPSVLEALKDGFGSAAFETTMDGLGKDAMAGFIAGMRALFPELANVMFGAKQVVVDNGNSAFNFGSPSKLMMNMGELVGEGFAQGLESSLSNLDMIGPETLGIPKRHQLIGGSSTNTTNSTVNQFDLQVNGSRNTGDDASAVLLTAQMIGVV